MFGGAGAGAGAGTEKLKLCLRFRETRNFQVFYQQSQHFSRVENFSLFVEMLPDTGAIYSELRRFEC